MRKNSIIVTILLASLLLVSLVACSKGTSNQSATTATETTTVVETKAETETKAEAEAPAVVEKAEEPVELTIDQKLCADMWCYSFSAAGYGDYVFFFHFYPEDPVLGSVYYAGMSNNRINFSGTYRIMEREYQYAAYKTREDEQADKSAIEGTAPYTVILYDWEGNIVGSVGFDGEKLINAQDKKTAKVYATGSAPFFYEKNDGSYDSTVAGEVPQVVYEYTALEDETSVIQINHNHTYTDLVAAMIEGTWTVSDKDGELNFALKPNDSTDTPATLVVAADKQTAVYTAEGSDPVEMGIPAVAVVVENVMEGTTPTSYGIDATITAQLMSDGTFTVIAAVAGREMEIDKGTWTCESGYKFTLNCEKAGVLLSDIVERSVHLIYKQAGTKIGDIEADLVTKQ